jgi:hypothetical protein
MRAKPRRPLLVLVMAVVLIGGCGTAVPDRSPTRTSAADPGSGLQRPSPAPPTTDLAWDRIGRIAPAPVIDVVGFSKGYVAVWRWPESGTLMASFSPDGREWRRVQLPFAPPRGEQSYNVTATVRALATNGRQVLAVGRYEYEPCQEEVDGWGLACPTRPVSWLTDDGVTWRIGQAPPSVDPGGAVLGSEYIAAWPVATGGWDAALAIRSAPGDAANIVSPTIVPENAAGKGRSLWHSTDGLTWTELGSVRLPGDPDVVGARYGGAAEGAGRRVLWEAFSRAGTPGVTTRLAAAADGRTWMALEGFPGDGASIMVGLAPRSPSGRWLLAGSSELAGSGATIWSSDDLVEWRTVPLAAARITDVVAGAGGHVAAGSLTGVGTPTADPTADALTWASGDGATWVAIPRIAGPDAGPGPDLLASGPAGVIGIATRGGDASIVWQLGTAGAPAAEATARPTQAPPGAPSAEPSPIPPLTGSQGPLRPDGLATVLATDLRMRTKPVIGAASTVLRTRLQPGDCLFVVAGPTNDSGHAWYQAATCDGELGWVAAASSAGEPWIEGRVPACPALPVDLGRLSTMTAFERVSCFGSRDLTFNAGIGWWTDDFGPTVPWGTPEWLNPIGYGHSICGLGDVAFAPGLGDPPVGMPGDEALGYRVTGHFDDPASRSCKGGTTTWDPESGAKSTDTQPTAVSVLDCRTRFVVTDLLWLDQVAAGETLTEIADWYGVTRLALVAENPELGDGTFSVGDLIAIPPEA